MAKAAQALRPGGRLVIHDYLAASSPAAARFTATLAVHLLVFTGRGNVYNLKDYAGLGKKVAIAGLYNRIEIWDEKKWDVYKKETSKAAEDIAEKMNELGI